MPPYGAAIIEDSNNENKKAMEEEKKQKEKIKEKLRGKKQKLGKTNAVFYPPFSQSEVESHLYVDDKSCDEIVDNTMHKKAKCKNIDEGKTKKVDKKEKKGKGPKLNF